jgi:hypothetical protein
MTCRLTPEERQVRDRYDRALTGIKNNITELSEQIASIEADLKELKPVVSLYNRENTSRVKSRVVFLQMKAAINELSKDSKDRAAEWTVLCRQIGNFIYDTTSIWTGYESEGLLKLKEQNPNAKGCKEHFFPRQRSGDFIASEYLRDRQMSFDRFCRLITRFCLTHQTTTSENEKLRKVQKRTTSLRDWRQDYDKVGVVVVKPKTPRPFLLTPTRRQKIKELLASLEYYQMLKRAMVEERVALNQSLKQRKKLYQLRVIGPSKMVTFDAKLLNTISVEGDESLEYDASTHGQSEGVDR